jgi:hypothetical protein
LKEQSAQAKAELTVNGLLVGASRLLKVVNYDAMAAVRNTNNRLVTLKKKDKSENMNSGEKAKKHFEGRVRVYVILREREG